MNTLPFKFLPWLRAGAATLIRGSDRADAASPAHFQTRVDLTVDGSMVSVPVHLLGPADAAGLETGQVLRRTPAPGAAGCEPHLFPAIEFRDADLPWRLTPVAPARDSDRLWPWLVLVAIEQQPGVAVRPFGGAPLPAVEAPRAELPDLADSALWAHVQVSGPFPDEMPGGLGAFVQAHPSRAVARLVCPRRLKPNTRYLLCLVPAFEAGRLAGLGQDLDEAVVGLQRAWTTDGAEPGVTLPVYDHWTFSTGAAEDPAAQFERLARALRPHHVSAGAALRTFDAQGTPLVMSGALRPAGLTTPAAPVALQQRVAGWVNRPADIEDGGGTPQLAPPLYAGRHAGQRRAGVPGVPKWFDELNLEPARRIAAAAGAAIVRKHQDTLVAEAWRQAGDVKPANALLRGAAAARGASAGLKSRFVDRADALRRLQMAGSALTKLPAPSGQSIAAAVLASGVPPAGFEAGWRRLARPLGPHLRRGVTGFADMSVPPVFLQRYEHYTPSWTTLHQAPADPGEGWFPEGDDIVQSGKIGSADSTIAKRGTLHLTGHPAWRDFEWTFRVLPQGSGAVGFVFRFKDTNNHYRLSIDRDGSYRRLVKCVNGTTTQLWSDSVRYTSGAEQMFSIRVVGSRIRITLNQIALVDITDSARPDGQIGYYSHNNSLARFKPTLLKPQLGFSTFASAGGGTLRRDEGTLGGASFWAVADDGKLSQTGTCHSDPSDRDSLPKRGGAIRLPAAATNDYCLSLGVIADTDGDCGVMFRMHPTQPSYYRLSVSVGGRYLRLVKCVNGTFTLLWQRDEGVSIGHLTDLLVTVDGNRITGSVKKPNEHALVFDVRDDSLPAGDAALYTWKSKLRFNRVALQPLRRGSTLASIDTTGLDVPALAAAVGAALDPASTVPARAASRLALPGSLAPAAAALAPLQLTPDFPQPLVQRLITDAPELLLPGLDGVPDAAVVMLEPDPGFIAALLAGANDEIGRELRWRGFPADPKATPFRQFWDVRGGAAANLSAAQREAMKDVPPLAAWRTDAGLAQQLASRAAGTVFLLRSELVRRFPDARVTLVQAVASGGRRAPGATVAPLLFSGRLADDIVYCGFDVPAPQASGADGGPGWYLAIEQSAGGLRFGLVQQRQEPPRDWTDVGWNDVAETPYLRPSTLALQPPPADPPSLRWSHNAAHMAAITRRRPFQLLVHASRLIQET